MPTYEYRDGYAALHASPESMREKETERLEDEMRPPLFRSMKKREPETNYKVKIFVNQKEAQRPPEKPKREWEEV